IDKFKCLKKAELTKILEEEKNILNRKITMEELHWAINKQKNDKTPGPDGLPAEIYKLQQDILSSKIRNDQTDPGNFRLISLLNVDYKIFVTIIAERLKKN
uniref:Uncharacterized protein n=1 Tax=Laticauda laticaudata TaxID=8630 RepID=A0A8C5SD27_LATLA